MSSFILADQTWLIWSTLLVITTLSIYLEANYQWAQKISGAIIALVCAMTLTNIGFLPMESPVYDTVWSYAIPLSIPMLLFKSDMRKILSESGRMLLIFCLGSLGTVLGSVIAFLCLRDYIPHLAEVAGMMTGSYIGGGINFVALSQVFNVPKGLISSTTVADNFNMAIYFILLITIPKLSFFMNHLTHPYIDKIKAEGKEELVKQDNQLNNQISSLDLAMTFAVSASIVAISQVLSDFFGQTIPSSNFVMDLFKQVLGNLYMIITSLTMILATLFPKFFAGLKAANEVGNFLIYIFFVVIGAPASLPLIIQTAPLLLVFCFIIVCVNMLVSFVSAKLFSFSVEETIIASNANIGGPATASVMAISQGWNDLIGPGIFVGLFGYIIGNYLGTLVGNLLLTW